EEQRSQRGCIADRMQLNFHHGLLAPFGGRQVVPVPKQSAGGTVKAGEPEAFMRIARIHKFVGMWILAIVSVCASGRQGWAQPARGSAGTSGSTQVVPFTIHVPDAVLA